MTHHCAAVFETATQRARSNSVQASGAPEPSEWPRGFGVRWLAGNEADTALDGLGRSEAKAVCLHTSERTIDFGTVLDAVDADELLGWINPVE